MAHHSTTPRFSLVFYSQFRRLWKFNSSRTVYIFFEHQFIVCFSQSSDSELFWGIESIALEQGCSCYRHSNINQQPRRILSFIDNDSGILIVNVTCTQSTCQLIVSYCLPENSPAPPSRYMYDCFKIKSGWQTLSGHRAAKNSCPQINFQPCEIKLEMISPIPAPPAVRRSKASLVTSIQTPGWPQQY